MILFYLKSTGVLNSFFQLVFWIPVCIWWKRVFLVSWWTCISVYNRLYHDGLWISTDTALFWRGNIIGNSFGEFNGLVEGGRVQKPGCKGVRNSERRMWELGNKQMRIRREGKGIGNEGDGNWERRGGSWERRGRNWECRGGNCERRDRNWELGEKG